MADGRSSFRGRMDKSLDEIAAEMGTTPELFGGDYEERRERRSTHRYSPYPTSRGPGWRDSRRSGDDDAEKRIFVANLNYTVTWQKLKDHMRKGQ